MVRGSLLLRAAGKHPSIQVRERSAWVRDFPDVSRSYLYASAVSDRWEASELKNLRDGDLSLAAAAANVGPFYAESVLRRLSGVKRTSLKLAAISANLQKKRTFDIVEAKAGTFAV